MATTEWFVTAARFERTAAPEIRPTERPSQMRVVAKGRWVETHDGNVLRRAGWPNLLQPGVREAVFELKLTGWRWIRKVLGRDLSGLL